MLSLYEEMLFPLILFFSFKTFVWDWVVILSLSHFYMKLVFQYFQKAALVSRTIFLALGVYLSFCYHSIKNVRPHTLWHLRISLVAFLHLLSCPFLRSPCHRELLWTLSAALGFPVVLILFSGKLENYTNATIFSEYIHGFWPNITNI